MSALSPAPGRTQPVLVAVHTLTAGQSLEAADLTVRQYPVELAPAGSLSSAELASGHRVTSAVLAGEPLTESRLVGPSMAQGLTDRVAVPVRIADADAARLAHPGDHIDLLAGPADPVGTGIGTGETGADSGAAPSLVLARDALVLVVPGPADQSAGGSGFSSTGALLVVAVPESAALQLAAATTPIQLLIRTSS